MSNKRLINVDLTEVTEAVADSIVEKLIAKGFITGEAKPAKGKGKQDDDCGEEKAKKMTLAQFKKELGALAGSTAAKVLKPFLMENDLPAISKIEASEYENVLELANDFFGDDEDEDETEEPESDSDTGGDDDEDEEYTAVNCKKIAQELAKKGEDGKEALNEILDEFKIKNTRQISKLSEEDLEDFYIAVREELEELED